MSNTTGRNTDAKVRLRIEEAKKLILNGRTTGYIREKLTKKYKICSRTVDYDIKQATLEIEEINKDGAKNLLDKLENNQWFIYRMAKKAKDWALARSVLMDIGKLRGLDVLKLIHENRELEGASEETLDQLEDEMSARANNYQN